MKDIDKQLDEIIYEVYRQSRLKEQDLKHKPYDQVKTQTKQAIKQLINQAYGRGTVDTLNHIKKWADKTEVTYNDMIKERLKELKGE